jgi:hypothetical protein
MSPESGVLSRRQPDSLADVLERVLDKGIVIAGDIVVNVLDIELLSLKLRLFVASAQTAQEMGMDWWTRDPFFTTRAQSESPQLGSDDEQQRLRQQNEQLRRELADLRDTLERAGIPAAQSEREAGR